MQPEGQTLFSLGDTGGGQSRAQSSWLSLRDPAVSFDLCRLLMLESRTHTWAHRMTFGSESAPDPRLVLKLEPASGEGPSSWDREG